MQCSLRLGPLLWCLLALPLAGAEPAERLAEARQTAARVDELLAAHWAERGIAPAAEAPAGEWVRRLSLDLRGRFPSLEEAGEAVPRLSPGDPDAVSRLVFEWLDGPEFPLHQALVLDQWVQQRHAGDEVFIGWLRRSLAAGESWEQIFRRLLLGPWETNDDRPAGRFLSKRIKNLDSLTTDTTRAFFGVDITCARCHDHPLVPDWTQDHYYGMASFFNRTVETGKGSAQFNEKPDGEVMFEAREGGSKTAVMMFLSGTQFPSVAKQVRREQLVSAALAERTFFSKALVNRTWKQLFGRGLVEPVDQMHSSNPPTIPAVLDFLAEDVIAHGYDVRHLVASLVLTKAYRASSQHSDPAAAAEFASARIRPLSGRQYALSLHVAAGPPLFLPGLDPQTLASSHVETERQSLDLLTNLEETPDTFQGSTTETLFLANHEKIQQLLAPQGENLTARLLRQPDDARRIDLAFQTITGRPPTEAERGSAAAVLQQSPGEPGLRDLVWALLTSAEFRFAP